MKDLTNHYIGKQYSPYDPPDGGYLGSLIAVFVGLIICAVITMFTSCGHTEVITKEIPVYLHDTLTHVSIQADTLIVTRHDSVWNNIFTKGDTVFVDRGRETTETKQGSSIKHDTVTVYIEVPVEVTETVTETKEVEKLLSWWQKTTQGVGLITIIASVLWLVWKLQKRFGWLSRIWAVIKALFRK